MAPFTEYGFRRELHRDRDTDSYDGATVGAAVALTVNRSMQVDEVDVCSLRVCPTDTRPLYRTQVCLEMIYEGWALWGWSLWLSGWKAMSVITRCVNNESNSVAGVPLSLRINGPCAEFAAQLAKS